ncbi:MAG: B12-binding domain-containing radical SAM protein [Candidatus Nealsonbacteria bacterium]|nr:B12-binding domain-containing radical SAM protein [Candidatus Nealsonbacteria bacterium]
MKILLVNPPFARFSGSSQSYYPLGLGYLSSYVAGRLAVDAPIYNVDRFEGKSLGVAAKFEKQDHYAAGVDDLSGPVWTEFRETIRSCRPDVVAVSVMSAKLPSAQSVVAVVRETLPEAVTVIGGPHATLDPQDTIDKTKADYVVRGEGEQTFAELIEKLMAGSDPADVAGLSYVRDGSLVSTADRPMLADLDSLPFPERTNLLFRERFSDQEFNVVVTSRGCPYRCSFCCAGPLWNHRVRFRSPANVAAEIETLIAGGYRKVLFWDDTFGSIPKRTIEMCEHFRRHLPRFFWSCTTRADVTEEMARQMAAAGCISVDLGLESASPRVIEKINKKVTVDMVHQAVAMLRRHGISVNIFLMVGFPFEREEDITETIRFVERSQGVEAFGLSCFTPYPGTPIFDDMVRQGELDQHTLDWRLLSHQSFHNRFNKSISPARFQELLDELLAGVESKNQSRTVARWHRYWRMFRYSPGAFVSTVMHK